MRRRRRLTFIFAALLTAVLFLLLLLVGPVDIPAADVLDILCGNAPEKTAWRTIILESRLPMAVTALLAGMALSTAGLILQTTFRNPLAGPSVLGISSGASLGVAIVMLAATAIPYSSVASTAAATLLGAILGAIAIILLLTIFSAALRNPLSLLIVGIMISYLSSSLISLLNFFAPAEGVRNFVVWGLGSYAGVTLSQLPVMTICILLASGAALFLAKPLNAMLLGDRYLETMGYSVRRLRTTMLCISGLLTAIVTAYCGPIGFIGLIVPHIARMALSSSNHFLLIPGSIVMGAIISLACTLVSVLPANVGVIPINAITPVAGVPIIIYILLNTKKLKYFN